MATFVLIPGAGTGPELWHRVVPELTAAGHAAVTPTLPSEDAAGLPEYVAAARAAAEGHDDLIVVGQSLGAFTAAALCAEAPARLLVYLNAMIPKLGETPGEWWENVGHAEAAADVIESYGPLSSWGEAALHEVFLHDVPPEVVQAAPPRKQGAGIFDTPLTVWPDTPVRVIAARDDRFFGLEFQRRVAQERLGAPVDEVPGGHVAPLSQPGPLARQLLSYL